MSFARLMPLFALVAVLVFASGAAAEELVVDNCKVVKVDGMKLHLSKSNGDKHAAEVASDAKITVDGKDSKLSDLKEGMKIKVTVRKGDGSPMIMKVEATTK